MLHGASLVLVLAEPLNRPKINHIEVRLVASSPVFILPTTLLAQDGHRNGTGIHDRGAFRILAAVSLLGQSLHIFRISIEDAVSVIATRAVSDNGYFGNAAPDDMTDDGMSCFVKCVACAVPPLLL